MTYEETFKISNTWKFTKEIYDKYFAEFEKVYPGYLEINKFNCEIHILKAFDRLFIFGGLEDYLQNLRIAKEESETLQEPETLEEAEPILKKRGRKNKYADD